jgi:hypothetical protein
MLTLMEVREIALSLPESEEIEHWSNPSFRINNKIFLIIQEDLKTITVKTTKEERDFYTNKDPETFRIPESFSNMNYMHINLEAAEKEEVINMIKSAWGRVAPKKLVKTYFQS